MDANFITAVTGIFKGKGGGAKLAMVGLFLLGIFSLVTDNDYEVDAGTAEGGKFKMMPHRSNEDKVPDEEEDGGGDPDIDPASAGEPV
jgi:hypothetical protein